MLIFSQGDDVVLNLKAQSSDAVAVDLTGATFESYVRDVDNEVISFPDDQHAANPNQTTHRGEFTLTLDNEDTDDIKAGISQEIITKISIAGKQVYYHGRQQMTVLPAAPEPEPDQTNA